MGEHSSESATSALRVQVTVAADPSQLPMLRALAETVALLSDFTLDEVADVRLAVDESASILMLDAMAATVLTCELIGTFDGLDVRVHTVAGRERLPDQHGFGWHVLRTLTDSITAVQRPYDPECAGYPTAIEFSRTRGSSSAR
jgi:serine/threonine-protein kinase RsbW